MVGSSQVEYWEHGRRFVARYIWPKGEKEIARLDLQHAILKTALAGNVFAPVEEPTRVLDLAAGSGIWCVEVARQFPHARVMGTDLDPKPLHALQVRLARAHGFPGNCMFEPHPIDVLRKLPFQSGAFSLVHTRHIAPFMSMPSWVNLIREMTRVAAPGGWLELVESEMPDCAGEHYQALIAAFIRWSKTHLGYYSIGQHFESLLAAAGLTAITIKQHVIGGTLSSQIALNMLRGLTLSADTIVRQGWMDEETIKDHLRHLPREMATGMTWHVYIGYGQKPAA